MYCSRCGNKIDDNSNFCPSCGKKIIRENNNKPQQDISSKNENISQAKIDSTINENNEEVNKAKINLNKYNSNTNNRVEENKEQDESQNEDNRCMYGNRKFEISAQKYNKGTKYKTIITFNETDITIKKENEKYLREYNQEYKFNIDDVLYVTNTKRLSIFMMIFTVCATLVCIYSFGIKALFTLIIAILFSIYRCLEIGFKNGDKINIILDGIFGKKDCTEIIEHMNRISGQRISNDKKYSGNVIVKNILSLLAAIGLVFGFAMFTALTEPASTVKIDNPYKDENTKNLYEEINSSLTGNKKEDTLAEDNSKEDSPKQEEIKVEQIKQEQVQQEETKKPTENIQEKPVEEKELSAEEAKNLIKQEDSNYLNQYNLVPVLISDGEETAISIMKQAGMYVEDMGKIYFFSRVEKENPDNEGGFYIVKARTKEVYRLAHDTSLPIYLISDNTISREYYFEDQKINTSRMFGTWTYRSTGQAFEITEEYFDGLPYYIEKEDKDNTVIIAMNGDYLYRINLFFRNYQTIVFEIYDEDINDFKIVDTLKRQN